MKGLSVLKVCCTLVKVNNAFPNSDFCIDDVAVSLNVQVFILNFMATSFYVC